MLTFFRPVCKTVTGHGADALAARAIRRVRGKYNSFESEELERVAIARAAGAVHEMRNYFLVRGSGAWQLSIL
jgi:hypothetical protein